MKCAICKKTDGEVELFEGILENEIVLVCGTCAKIERIPLIRKPSDEQLKKAETRQSVRERMERMSGMRSDISDDQMNVQRNLARLRAPGKRERNNEVIENYDWTIKIERRRRKMTPSQLARFAGTDTQKIIDIEGGRLPKDYKEIFLRLESYLGIKLLQHHESEEVKIDEEKVLEGVRAKLGIKPKKKEVVKEAEKIEEPVEKMDFADEKKIINDDEKNKNDDVASFVAEKFNRRKEERLNRMNRNEIDFSDRKDMTNVTLNDLVELKREKEKREKKMKEKEVESTLMGDDLNLDLDEV